METYQEIRTALNGKWIPFVWGLSDDGVDLAAVHQALSRDGSIVQYFDNIARFLEDDQTSPKERTYVIYQLMAGYGSNYGGPPASTLHFQDHLSAYGSALEDAYREGVLDGEDLLALSQVQFTRYAHSAPPQLLLTSAVASVGNIEQGMADSYLLALHADTEGWNSQDSMVSADALLGLSPELLERAIERGFGNGSPAEKTRRELFERLVNEANSLGVLEAPPDGLTPNPLLIAAATVFLTNSKDLLDFYENSGDLNTGIISPLNQFLGMTLANDKGGQYSLPDGANLSESVAAVLDSRLQSHLDSIAELSQSDPGSRERVTNRIALLLGSFSTGVELEMERYSEWVEAGDATRDDTAAGLAFAIKVAGIFLPGRASKGAGLIAEDATASFIDNYVRDRCAQTAPEFTLGVDLMESYSRYFDTHFSDLTGKFESRYRSVASNSGVRAQLSGEYAENICTELESIAKEAALSDAQNVRPSLGPQTDLSTEALLDNVQNLLDRGDDNALLEALSGVADQGLREQFISGSEAHKALPTAPEQASEDIELEVPGRGL